MKQPQIGDHPSDDTAYTTTRKINLTGIEGERIFVCFLAHLSANMTLEKY